MVTRVTWVIATEDPIQGQLKEGRVHAYDLVEQRVPHPLGGVKVTIRHDQLWTDAAPGPRCQHCLQIVGQEHSGG